MINLVSTLQIKEIALNCKDIEDYSDDALHGFEAGFKHLEKKTDELISKNLLMTKQLSGIQQMFNLLDIKIDLSDISQENIDKVRKYVDENDSVLIQAREYMPFN